MPAYALTIFLGAFLVFQAQPIMGKYILPWFGGGPGVWTTCMLFFQLLLLGGYAYAHGSARWLKPRAQALAQVALLLAALPLLPITPRDAWKPAGEGNPTVQILAVLAASLGLPYFVLSATGPLMQQWFSRTHGGASPYRLYALSNLGSLLALVSFPFFFEPRITRKTQAEMWTWGFAAYAVCCGFCALKLWRTARGNASRSSNAPASSLSEALLRPTPALDRILWLLLPFCASVLLLATTNKLCEDVAVIPFLWVLPLAVYLLSFIICFDSPRWYVRGPFVFGLIAASAGVCWALFKGVEMALYRQIAIYSGALFVCCMVCHGELYRLRPDPRRLTGFYLMIAAGGALGGVFVAIIAPLIFPDYWELHCGLFLCGALLIVACARGDRGAALKQEPTASSRPFEQGAVHGTSSDLRWRWPACALTVLAFIGIDRLVAWAAPRYHSIPRVWFVSVGAGAWACLAVTAAFWIACGKFKRFRHWRVFGCAWLALGLAALGIILWHQARKPGSDTIYASRNFYGVLTVFEESKSSPKDHYFLLQHGRITHGLQFADPEQAVWPTTYYGEDSGVGLAVRALPARPRRIGLVGLGTGTLTSYARAGDYVRIYEINPEVRRLAATRFTYLARCPGTVEVTPGDARLSMEKEPPQNFDLLALDAFSSDAIPVHLLTRESFALYGRHLNPSGVIAVHISNHYLDLEPVVVNLARHFNYRLAAVDYDESEESWWVYSSTWILLSRNGELLDTPAIHNAAYAVNTNAVKVPLWTDDFASLFQILRRGGD